MSPIVKASLLVGFAVWGRFGLAADADLPAPSFQFDNLDGPVMPLPDGRTAVAGGVSTEFSKPHLIDVRTGARRAFLKMPEGSRGGIGACSADSRLVGGTIGLPDKTTRVMIWDAENGSVINEAEWPSSAIYGLTMRFAPAGDRLYLGSRKALFEFDLKKSQLQVVSTSVTRYVLDIAALPARNTVYFVDGIYFKLRILDRSEGPPLASLRWPISEQAGKPQDIWSIDISADGSELAAVVHTLMPTRETWSTVFRFDLRTGKVLHHVTLFQNVMRIRYAGASKVLVVTSDIFQGKEVGFLKPAGTAVQTEFQIMDHLEDCVVDPSKDGHLTIGYGPGTLKQWLRKDWPPKWRAVFDEE